ncbi:MAG: deoxyhypusine synthase family protein [Chloroflexi bacterium]|nr:deoxyhypusine synthase family protein [Chloroflexota bacterium]
MANSDTQPPTPKPQHPATSVDPRLPEVERVAELTAESLLVDPLAQLTPVPGRSVRDLLGGLAETSYQGRNLGTALGLWEQMLQDRTTIILCFAGAMVAAGMRSLVSFLIEHRYVDVLVSTGANLSHDVVESFGYQHFRGSPTLDDRELGRLAINRVYDNLVAEEGFIREEDYVTDFALGLEQRPYTTREFLMLLGKQLPKDAKTKGIVTTAAAANVPIYCPALADSSMGMGLANARLKGGTFQIDVLQDVVETARIVIEAQRAETSTGIIVIGGGTPRNFAQQAAVATYMFKEKGEHKYSLIVTTDAPHWGGLSGSTPQEAQSWRKFRRDAEFVTVHADATIALPVLAQGVFEAVPPGTREWRPRFSNGREFAIDFG